MAINVLDFDDAMEQNKVDVRAAFEDYQKEFYAPLVDMQLSKFWKSIPDEVKVELRSRNKKAVDRLDRKLGGK